jgi:hypothetical protein
VSGSCQFYNYFSIKLLMCWGRKRKNKNRLHDVQKFVPDA